MLPVTEIEAMFRLASLLTGGDRPPVEAEEDEGATTERRAALPAEEHADAVAS